MTVVVMILSAISQNKPIAWEGYKGYQEKGSTIQRHVLLYTQRPKQTHDKVDFNTGKIYLSKKTFICLSDKDRDTYMPRLPLDTPRTSNYINYPFHGGPGFLQLNLSPLRGSSPQGATLSGLRHHWWKTGNRCRLPI